VKAAYHALAREWHPDAAGSDERRRRLAEERFRRIGQAYETLSTVLGVVESHSSRVAPTPDGWSRDSAYQVYGGKPPKASEVQPNSAERAALLYLDGLDAFRHGDYRGAVSALLQSVCISPDNAEAQRLLGRSHLLLGAPQKAETAFERAMRLEPDSLETAEYLAKSYLAVGDFEKTIRFCRKWVDESPKDAEMWLALGKALRNSGKLTEARDVLAEVLHRDPHNPEALFEMVLVNHKLGDVQSTDTVLAELKDVAPQLAASIRLGVRETRPS
jgi:Flp pilus assembly protein TadD